MFHLVTLSYRPAMRRLMIILSLPLLVAAGFLMYHHSLHLMYHHTGPAAMHVHGRLTGMYHHGRHLVAMHFHGNPAG